MGFFQSLKEDLSEAVNGLIGEDEEDFSEEDGKLFGDEDVREDTGTGEEEIGEIDLDAMLASIEGDHASSVAGETVKEEPEAEEGKKEFAVRGEPRTRKSLRDAGDIPDIPNQVSIEDLLNQLEDADELFPDMPESSEAETEEQLTVSSPVPVTEEEKLPDPVAAEFPEESTLSFETADAVAGLTEAAGDGDAFISANTDIPVEEAGADESVADTSGADIPEMTDIPEISDIPGEDTAAADMHEITDVPENTDIPEITAAPEEDAPAGPVDMAELVAAEAAAGETTAAESAEAVMVEAESVSAELPAGEADAVQTAAGESEEEYEPAPPAIEVMPTPDATPVIAEAMAEAAFREAESIIGADEYGRMSTSERVKIIREKRKERKIMEQQRADETAVITQGMVIKGDIEADVNMDVCGTIEGNIEIAGKLNVSGVITGNSTASEVYADGAEINGDITSAGSVKVGQSTVIIGNVTATSAVIAGAIKGDIDVRGPVILDSAAIVMGNIKSMSVQISNGAVVEGMCSQVYAAVNPSSFFEDFKKNSRGAAKAVTVEEV